MASLPRALARVCRPPAAVWLLGTATTRRKARFWSAPLVSVCVLAWFQVWVAGSRSGCLACVLHALHTYAFRAVPLVWHGSCSRSMHSKTVCFFVLLLPTGYFNNVTWTQSNRTTCIECPTGLTTKNAGSTSAGQCNYCDVRRVHLTCGWMRLRLAHTHTRMPCSTRAVILPQPSVQRGARLSALHEHNTEAHPWLLCLMCCSPAMEVLAASLHAVATPSLTL